MRLDAESNRVSHEERECDERRLCWSITPICKQCTQLIAVLWGRDPEGRAFSLHRSWWRLGTSTSQGDLCREWALDSLFLHASLKHVSSARSLLNVGLQEQITHILHLHQKRHWEPPWALGTLVFGFPSVTCCRCPDRGGHRCGQSPGSSRVSRVPAPRHHWGYVPASAHCWRSCVCSWAGLIPWINQRFISTVPGCIRGEVDEETGCLNNKRIASGAAIPQGAKTAIGCWQDFSLALHPWVSPSPLLTYCLHHQFLTACSAAFLEGSVLDLNPLVLNELNI